MKVSGAEQMCKKYFFAMGFCQCQESCLHSENLPSANSLAYSCVAPTAYVWGENYIAFSQQNQYCTVMLHWGGKHRALLN